KANPLVTSVSSGIWGTTSGPSGACQAAIRRGPLWPTPGSRMSSNPGRDGLSRHRGTARPAAEVDDHVILGYNTGRPRQGVLAVVIARPRTATRRVTDHARARRGHGRGLPQGR